MSEATDSSVPAGLVGFANFKRHNPMSDKFASSRFHHIEFYCADATTTYNRFSWGLGMTLVAKSDQSTGNHTFASYVVKSNQVRFVFTAPYSKDAPKPEGAKPAVEGYDPEFASYFIAKHGLAVRAVGVTVEDAADAYEKTTAAGAKGVLPPSEVVGKDGSKIRIAEVEMYQDVVIRFVEKWEGGDYLPSYEAVDVPPVNYGLTRIDHVVSNVPKLLEQVQYMCRTLGWHEFAEFTSDDVGTVDSGLNSMVIANNNEMILMPVNEPTFGTPRKSQIQTFLEQNTGPGVQHMAIMTNDIFHTLTEMRNRTHCGGFDFMPRPKEGYYERLVKRIGEDALTEEQLRKCEELGILVDRDDQGTLLQIFTKPLGDRPTIFIEIIQRLGCEFKDPETGELDQKGGCGGFGKGNFSELFKSIEEYEKTLDVKKQE